MVKGYGNKMNSKKRLRVGSCRYRMDAIVDGIDFYKAKRYVKYGIARNLVEIHGLCEQ